MASCKFEGGKCKGTPDAKAHMRHNDISPERRAIARKGNKHIDPGRSKYNFSILGLSYEECAKKYDDRIADLDSHGNTNRRKDRVTMQIIEVPVPADLPRNQYKKWFAKVTKFLIKKYGKINFVECYVHYDEEHTYRNPETKELVWSRVHMHFMFIPVSDGKLNAKKLSLRKNMKALNREVDDMTQAEFGCSFMTGTKKKSVKSVEQLKQESEYAEMFYQLEQKKKELEELKKKVQFEQNVLAKRLEEVEDRERGVDGLQELVSEIYRSLECDEGALREKLRILEEALEECERLAATYKQAAERLEDTPAEIPQKEFMEDLSERLGQILSGFTYKDGTLWGHTEKPIMDSIRNAVKAVQGRMPGTVLKEEESSVQRGEAAMASTMRNLKARELPLDEETFRKWNGRHADEDVQMVLLTIYSDF